MIPALSVGSVLLWHDSIILFFSFLGFWSSLLVFYIILFRPLVISSSVSALNIISMLIIPKFIAPSQTSPLDSRLFCSSASSSFPLGYLRGVPSQQVQITTPYLPISAQDNSIHTLHLPTHPSIHPSLLSLALHLHIQWDDTVIQALSQVLRTQGWIRPSFGPHGSRPMSVQVRTQWVLVLAFLPCSSPHQYEQQGARSRDSCQGIRKLLRRNGTWDVYWGIHGNEAGKVERVRSEEGKEKAFYAGKLQERRPRIQGKWACGRNSKHFRMATVEVVKGRNGVRPWRPQALLFSKAPPSHHIMHIKIHPHCILNMSYI